MDSIHANVICFKLIKCLEELDSIKIRMLSALSFIILYFKVLEIKKKKRIKMNNTEF